MAKLRDHIYFYVDESYEDRYAEDKSYQGSFLGVGIVVVIGEENLKNVKNALLAHANDPVFRHRNDGSGGIHFADNNLSPRIMTVDTLHSMPVSSYLSYRMYTNPSLTKQQKDEITYRELLPSVLRSVATKYKHNFNEQPVKINLQFEQLSNKKEKDKRFFLECIKNLDFNFDVKVVGKQDLYSALPDYFLGLLRNLVLEPSANWPKDEIEVVEDKIGLIINATTDKMKHYSRGTKIREFIRNPEA